jgi:hypothetical protein
MSMVKVPLATIIFSSIPVLLSRFAVEILLSESRPEPKNKDTGKSVARIIFSIFFESFDHEGTGKVKSPRLIGNVNL